MMETGRRVGNPPVCSIPQPRAVIRAEETWQAAGGSVGLQRSMAQADRKSCVIQKKNPRDSHAGDPGMLPSSNGALVPEAIIQTTGGLGGQQHQPGSWCRLTRRQQATILVKVAENRKTRPKKI